MIYSPMIYLDRFRMAAPSVPAEEPQKEGFRAKLQKETLRLVGLVPEIGHLSPLILTTGALFFSAATVNYPLFMFALSSAEAGAIYVLIKSLSDYLITPTFGVERPSDIDNNTRTQCSSSFQTLTTSRFRLMMDNGIKKAFPNFPIYFIVFAVVYCIEGLLFFANEASEIGPAYSNRPYMSIIGGSFFFVLYSLYFYVYGCDTLFNLSFTVILAAMVAYLIAQQNVALFGRNSMNLMYIPPLVQRTGMDYVCVTTKST